MKKITESEFCEHHRVIESEIRCITSAFYTWLEFDNFARESKENLYALNKNAGFWNLQKLSLQTTFFIILGRVFDKNGENLTLHKFIKLHTQHPEFFTKESLRARKEISGLNNSDILETYLKNITEPTKEELRGLKKSLSCYSSQLETYRVIRNLYGHNIPIDKAEKDNLFAAAQIDEIEEFLYCINDLQNGLWQLFYNGRVPKFGTSGRGYVDDIKKRTRKVLNELYSVT